MNWIRTKEMVKTIIMEFTRERSLMHGAALAYYSMLALIPMLYLSISYVGMIVGNDVIIGVIESVLNEWIGIEDASGIISFLDEVDFNKSSWVLQLAGILALLFSCTAIFNSMRRSLNAFYGIDDIIIPRKKVILRNLLSRFTSMLFVFGATLLFVVIYFMETIFMSFSTKFLEDVEWLNTLFLTIFNNGLPILTNLLVFSFIFKYMHDGVVEWKMALRGGLLTGVFLYLGQLLIRYYLTNYFFAANGGVAGTMLVILVWVYYSSQIIFFGAKYIAVASRMAGKEIKHRD